MELKLSYESLEKAGLTEEDIFLLLAYNNVKNVSLVRDSLIERGLISRRREDDTDGYFLTSKALELLTTVYLDSDKSKRNLTKLVAGLKEIYPKGMKGTGSRCYYWVEGNKLVERRLKIFFKKYGNHYTDEEILDATRRYVKSFQGDYTYMSLLKYFIFKEKKGNGGDVEPTSDLLNYLEHKDDEVSHNTDWMDVIF